VIVATVRALKHHGSVYNAGDDAKTDDDAGKGFDAVRRGIPNLIRHVENIKNVFGLPTVVAINRFPDDTEAELDFISGQCEALGVVAVPSDVWAQGGSGGSTLAKEVVRLCDEPNNFRFCYPDELSITEKINAVAKKVYRAANVTIVPSAENEISKLEEMGFGSFPVCIAKTQYSFSDDPSLLCAPEGFDITVRRVRVSAGAGFVVAFAGNVMTMPGLPRSPAAEKIDVDENGRITGLF
jgi:formate--tetrahydrofolate ligase